jgi:predicted dehydrogenase
MPEINVGVVGIGFIGLAHIEALRRLGINVAGVVGSDSAELASKAASLRLPRVYTSFAALIADPRINVVHLSTPNHLHYQHARAALLAGKHVICEKPLALTSRESAELVKLAGERGLVNAVNFSLRFYPVCHQARALVSTGEVGDVWMLKGSYLQDWLLLPSDWNWRLEPELGGELRAVADIGSHWLDLMTFITGQRVAAVMADLHTFLPVRQKPRRAAKTFGGGAASGAAETVDQAIATEDYASILLRYTNGTRGVLMVSQVSAGRKNQLSFEIGGSHTSLAWNSERPDELWIGHRDRANEVLMRDPALLAEPARAITGYPGGHAEGFADTFKQLYRAVYRAIEDGRPPAQPDYPTFADGHEELLLGEAILRSARESRWIEIERSTL